MAVVHSHVPPERFVVGTVGQPGQRTFFLQARTGPRVTSVALEKQQVAVLAERLDQLLDELLEIPENRSVVPAVTPVHMEDAGPLEQPIVEEFRAGTMTLSWDVDAELVVLEVFSTEPAVDAEGESSDASPELADALEEALDEALTDELADALADALEGALEDEQYAEMLLVRMGAAQARAFCSRAKRVLGAGRPDCPFCGNPIDPDGHLCVRANGFRRRPA